MKLAFQRKWIYNKFFLFWLLEHSETSKQNSLPIYVSIWKQRYVRLIFIQIAIFATTGIVFSWQPFSSMLLGSNAFSWLCTETEINAHQAAILTDSSKKFLMICKLQNESIQVLYNLFAAAEFLFGVVAGLLLDYFGPLITGFVGQVFLILGFIFLIVSSKSFPLYHVSVILLGGACNFIVFPAFATSDYFAKYSGFIISLTIACQNGSAVITTILDLIFRTYNTITFQAIFFYYLLVVVFPLAILYIACLPLIRYTLNPRYSSETINEQIFKNQNNCSQLETLQTPKRKTSKDHNLVIELSTSPKFDQYGVPQSSEEKNEDKLNDDIALKRTAAPYDICIESATLTGQPIKESCWKNLKTPEFMIFSLFVFLSMLQYNFYTVILRDFSGPTIARFNGYIFPTVAFWGIIFGCIIDYFTTIPIAMFLIFLIAAVYSLMLIPSEGLQYLTTILFVIGTSFIYSVKFTYISEIFPAHNSGVLMGALSFISGLTMIVNNFLPKLNHHTVIYNLLGSTVLSFSFLYWLNIRRLKGITYKENEIIQSKSSNLAVLSTTESLIHTGLPHLEHPSS